MNTISTAKIWDNEKYDTIIDVRSPSEFNEDHIPGAINLPVLDDEERKIIGIIYKKKSSRQTTRIDFFSGLYVRKKVSTW